MEQWKEVAGTNGQYEVSNTGFLRTHNWKNAKQTRVMKPAMDDRGYMKTIIVVNGKNRNIAVHRLVAEAWIPNPENKSQVNHINFNPSDNRVENLEWCTPKENAMHSYKAGRIKKPVYNDGIRGSQNGMSKLTEDQVREIRQKFKPRIYTREMLGREYGVAPSTIKDVILRRWKHVT
jgi:hypothetical protein